MTDAACDEGDDDDDEPSGPSLAYPPFYVLRSAASCPACGRVQHVYALGCSAFHDAESRRPVEDFHFLNYVRRLPEAVLAWLQDRAPGYFLDAEEEGDTPYLMNHCRCGARLDGDFLHGDVGAAFWPDTPEGFRHIRLFRLPESEPIEVECSCTIGGGEYLDFGKTWT